MSTRSCTHFLGVTGVEAIVYRHSDGYPRGHGADLLRGLRDVREHCSDPRLNDPSYLAARLVVWLAHQYAWRFHDGDLEPAHPLDFLGVGIVAEDPSDVDYLYLVDTRRAQPDGLPLVRCLQVDWSDRAGELVVVAERDLSQVREWVLAQPPVDPWTLDQPLHHALGLAPLLPCPVLTPSPRPLESIHDR